MPRADKRDGVAGEVVRIRAHGVLDRELYKMYL